MKHNLKQFFGIFLTLTLCISSAFGIDIYVSELYQEIDIAFLNHSDVELDRILDSNQDDEKAFVGFAARYSKLTGAATSKQIVNFGGTGDKKQTSIY